MTAGVVGRLFVTGGRWGGDWPPRFEGGGGRRPKKDVRRHARAGCCSCSLLHAHGHAPGPAPGAAVPVRGMVVGAEGEPVHHGGRQWRGRRGGGRWTQGRGDGRATKVGGLGESGKGEVCLRLVPGGKEGGAVTPPKMVNPLFDLSRPSLRPEPGRLGSRCRV